VSSFTRGVRVRSSHWIGCWVGPIPAGNWTPVVQSVAYSLYWLSYHGSADKECPALNDSEMKYYISEMKAGVKLCPSSFIVVTAPVFTAWSGSYSRRMRAALDSWVPSRFASVEEMFPVRQKVDCVLWLVELKSYTRVRPKFNQLYRNQPVPIYRSVMRWDKCLKRTGSVLRQHGPPHHTVSQDNVEGIREAFQRRPHKSAYWTTWQ
jgi:hypothetical protein